MEWELNNILNMLDTGVSSHSHAVHLSGSTIQPQVKRLKRNNPNVI